MRRKTIKINDEYSIRSDRWNWVLLQHYIGKDKKGNEIPATKETFHRDLDAVARYVVNEGLKNAESFVEMASMAELASQNVRSFLEGQNKQMEE